MAYLVFLFMPARRHKHKYEAENGYKDTEEHILHNNERGSVSASLYLVSCSTALTLQ